MEHFQVNALGTGGRERSITEKKSYLSSTLGESFLYMSTWGDSIASFAPSSSSASRPLGAYPSKAKNTTVTSNDRTHQSSGIQQSSPLKKVTPKILVPEKVISPTAGGGRCNQDTDLQSLLADSVYGSFLEPYRKTSYSSPRRDVGEAMCVDERAIPDNILKLLQTIRRLGEENAALLLRVERLKTFEEGQKQLLKDVATFKKTYEDKFKRVRDELKDFSVKHPHLENPANIASPEKISKQLSRDKADEAKRIAQLEKMVQGLLDRIEMVSKL